MLFKSKNNNYSKKNILLLSDKLQVEKSETNLLNLSKTLIEAGYSCTVVSANDSTEKEIFQNENIKTEILNSDYKKHYDKIIEYAKCFDLVIANGVDAYDFVELLKGKVSLVWYMRETDNTIEFIAGNELTQRHPNRSYLNLSNAAYQQIVKRLIEENTSNTHVVSNERISNFSPLFKKKTLLINLGFIKFRVTLNLNFLLGKIFLFSDSINYKTITFLWKQYRFEYLSRKNIENINKFLTLNFKENAILLVEINDCHGEVLPGYSKYFSDLGYNVDVVMPHTEYSLNPFVRCKSDNLHVFELSKLEIKYLLKNKKISSYRYIVFNSDITINCLQDKLSSLFQYFGKIQKPQKDFISVIHQPEYIDDITLNTSKNIILADLPLKLNPKPTVVNPHYFGEVKITPKNDAVTDFIVIGSIQKQRKNYDLLIEAVQGLVNKGITNFKITVIGQYGHLGYMPENICQYIDFRGKLDFENMFSAMERADFFLPLLDPENPDHERYITTGTSGSFQLIYGFAKPCLICKKFADVHGFTNSNSIIYNANSDLEKSMTDAINMSSDVYAEKQKELKQYSQDLYQKSLENLRGMLNE